jgi:UDP-3-O-[3-hydroxymyristoyl] glucosamine N-acyltransferase
MSHQIADTARVLAGVVLGAEVFVEDFCILGALPRSVSGADMTTVIGDNACIRSHTVIYAGNKIGRNFQAGNKVNIRELNDIGDNVSIGTLSVIEHHVRIDDNVRIHSQVFNHQ